MSARGTSGTAVAGTSAGASRCGHACPGDKRGSYSPAMTLSAIPAATAVVRVAADAGVQPVQADRQLRPLDPNRAGENERHPHGGVHRNGEGHAVGPLHEGGVPGLDRDVEGSHVVALRPAAPPPERPRAPVGVRARRWRPAAHAPSGRYSRTGDTGPHRRRLIMGLPHLPSRTTMSDHGTNGNSGDPVLRLTAPALAENLELKAGEAAPETLALCVEIERRAGRHLHLRHVLPGSGRRHGRGLDRDAEGLALVVPGPSVDQLAAPCWT